MYWAHTELEPRAIEIDSSVEERGSRLICRVSADEVAKELAGFWRELRHFVKEVTVYQLVRGRQPKLKEAGTPFSMLKHAL